MKPTIDLLKKALRECAKAHRAGFSDRTEDEQIGIASESVPTVNDIRMICESFYGHSRMIETGWGYTTVYLDCDEMLDELDETKLRMALPNGTVLA